MEHSSKGKSSISTHAPLAGRDRKSHSISYVPPVFQPTRPLRGATCHRDRYNAQRDISTHAPLAGRDLFVANCPPDYEISTHAPLAGRDRVSGLSDQ